MPAAFDLIAQAMQAHGKLGTIHAGCILLGLEQAALLERARLAVLAFGHIEDDGMGVKLRRSITVNRAGSVMLEGGRNKLASRLRCMDVADTRLRVTLQFSKCNADAFPVRLPDTLIASYKGGEGDGLRRGECSIPSRAVLHAGDFLAVLVFVGARWLMLDELQAAFRMLAFTQAGEVLGAAFAIETPLLRELSLPLVMRLFVAAPVVLLFGGKLAGVIRPRLAR
jgi:hypothetical protein